MCTICRLLFVATGFFLLTSSANSLAQEPLILTLDKAIVMALEQNTSIQTSRIDIQIAQQQIRETTAIGLPQVSAALGYQYYLDVPTSLVPAEFFGGSPGEFAEIQFGTEQNLFASVSVDQIIFSGEYIVGLRAARIYRDLASHGLKRTELEVRTMTTETYLLSLLAKQNLQIVRENLTNMQQTLFETEKILEAGFTDPINADQLKLTVANLKNTVSGLERQYQVTLNLLKFQIGLDIMQGVELADDFERLMNNLSIDALSLQDFDPENHIDYRLTATQEAFTSMVLKREQSFFLPSLTASFVRQEMAMRNSFNFLKEGFPWFPTSYFGVNLNIPIFSSGMRSARVQQARLELDKARIATWQVNQTIRMQMEQSRSEFDTALEQYNNQKENLELAERILARTRIMHKEGMVTSLELTQSSDQLLSTQAGYLSAMFDLLNAKNKFEKAMGR
jgi:outer membrane protein